jgi:hypothetical protein
MVVGRADRRSLEEIWNGPELTSLRLQIARHAYTGLPVCSRCDRPRRRQLGGMPLEYAWRFFRDQV